MVGLTNASAATIGRKTPGPSDQFTPAVSWQPIVGGSSALTSRQTLALAGCISMAAPVDDAAAADIRQGECLYPNLNPDIDVTKYQAGLVRKLRGEEFQVRVIEPIEKSIEHEAVEKLRESAFERYFAARGEMRDTLGDFLVRYFDPKSVFRAGVSAYKKKGNFDRIHELISLLSQQRGKCYPALQLACETSIPHPELFVSMVAEVDFLDPPQRQWLLERFASSDDPAAREQVASVLEYVEADHIWRKRLLGRLSGDVEDTVAEAACDTLDELGLSDSPR